MPAPGSVLASGALPDMRRRGLSCGRTGVMQVVSALFAQDLQIREVDGPSTRLDIGGIKFSEAAPSEPPFRIEPHLFVIVRCATVDKPQAMLEVRFLRGEEQVARNVQPLSIEPGKFAYRLVKAELDFDEYGTVEAHVSLDRGDPTVVPFTVLPFVSAGPNPESSAE